jgi:hypothetical protein
LASLLALTNSFLLLRRYNARSHDALTEHREARNQVSARVDQEQFKAKGVSATSETKFT